MLREARKQKTKQSIIQHAITLFKQKGYENVTVEEITNACGIAKGTFFNYFPKKEHILLHITDSYMELLSQMIERHQQVPIKEQLVYIFRDLLAIYIKYFELLRLTLEQTIKTKIRSSETSTNMTRFQEVLSLMIEKAKVNGSLNSKWDANKIASVLMGLFLHSFIQVSPHVHQELIVEIFQQQIDIIWEGIENE